MKKKNIKNPPRPAEWLLRHFIKYEDNSSILGDFDEEFFEIAESCGNIRANFWYWRQVFKSLPVIFLDTVLWSLDMFRNYFKVAARNLIRNKVYSFINIFCLAVGITCTLFILFWAAHELSFDNYHKNKDKLYRVAAKIQYADKSSTEARTPPAAAPAMKQNFPEVAAYARLIPENTLLKYRDKVFPRNLIFYTDPSVFDLFTYEFVSGTQENALSAPNSIVISERIASRFFGNEEAVGKILNTAGNDRFTVSAVIKNVPENSHLKVNFLSPLPVNERLNGNWRFRSFYTYVLLQKGTDVNSLNTKIQSIIEENSPKGITSISLQPVQRIHLYREVNDSLAGHGDIKYIYILSTSAFLILLIACINFINLSTAQSINRTREVGLRKVIGAKRSDIIRQHLGESLVFSLFALILSFLFVFLLKPVYINLSGSELIINRSSSITIITSVISIAIFTGILSGSFPAFYLSSFQPVKSLKGKSSSFTRHGSKLRKVLVITQFAFAIGLLVCSLAVYSQLSYIQEKDLGFNEKNLITISDLGRHLLRNYDAVKNELLQHPDIVNVTRGTMPLGLWGGRRTTNVDWDGKTPDTETLVYNQPVDTGFLDTYELQMAEGRFFSADFTADTSNFILNESAVSVLGINSPVGKRFSMNGRSGKIIGVVKDFFHSSLREEIEPDVLYIGRSYGIVVRYRIGLGNTDSLISFLKKLWGKYNTSGSPLNYSYLEDRLDNLYKDEHRMGTIFNYTTILALIISCLGLFGLASFMTKQRTKEIGIRKTLGSSIPGIILLLSKDITRLVLLANIFAWPASWYFMNRWLRNFAYKTDLDHAVFLFAGISTLIIAVITISYQVIKAARINPADSIRYE